MYVSRYIITILNSLWLPYKSISVSTLLAILWHWLIKLSKLLSILNSVIVYKNWKLCYVVCKVTEICYSVITKSAASVSLFSVKTPSPNDSPSPTSKISRRSYHHSTEAKLTPYPRPYSFIEFGKMPRVAVLAVCECESNIDAKKLGFDRLLFVYFFSFKLCNSK